MKKTITTTAAAACVATLSAGAALADYPERSINMIVAYSAGGGTDIAARTLVPYIEKYLGEDANIAVLNKPGAGGEIGFTELAQAKPDGYTIGFVNTPNLVTIPIQRQARYTIEDIAPIANVVYDPGAFSVRADSDIKTLEDLVAYAKENPGLVTYGTTGLGSDDHLAALTFERQAGVELKHVPFSGNVDVRAAVLGGHIMLASMNISETAADIEEGTLTALGQMAEERWEGAPDTPTFQEQGYDVVMGSQRGLAAPAGVPEEVLSSLQEAVRQAIEDPEFQAAAEEQALPLDFMTGDEFEADMQRQHESYQAIWEEQPWVQQ